MSQEAQENERKQKNLRVLPETAARLEEMALERYGSQYKQGQVVDELVANEGSGDLLRMVSEMHEVVCPERDDSESTHTTQTEYEADDPAKELERIAKEQGYLVVDEHDLSVLGGARGVDKTAVYIAALRGAGYNKVTKGQVRDLIMQEVGVSYNSANQHAQQVILQLHDSPLSGMESWVSDAVDQCLDMTLNGKDGLRRKDNKFTAEFGKSLQVFAGLPREPESTGEVYYLDYETMVKETAKDMATLVAANANRQYPKSVMTQLTAQEMVDRVSESDISGEEMIQHQVTKLTEMITLDEVQ